MPRLDRATRNIAIGLLHAGESQNEVARTMIVNQSTISRLWNRFQQTGWTNEHQRSGRPRIATPGQDRYIRVFHLRNRTIAASTTAAGIPGLRRTSSQTVRNRLRPHGIRPRRPHFEMYLSLCREGAEQCWPRMVVIHCTNFKCAELWYTDFFLLILWSNFLNIKHSESI